MSLTPAEVSKLKQLIRLASELLESVASADRQIEGGAKETAVPKVAVRQSTVKRHRRSGKELVAFRKMLKAERKRGVSVAELARQHGISTAYIYQIG